MIDLVAVDVADSDVAMAARTTGATVVKTRVNDIRDVVDEDSTLVVVAAARHGVDLAKAVHVVAPGVPVVFLAEHPVGRDELEGILAITPGISRHTRCLVADRTETAEALVDEIGRRRLRARHRRTLEHMQDSLGKFSEEPRETLTRYLRQLFDQAPIGILITDRNGIIQAANPGSGHMLGWPPRQMIGADFAGMFADDAATLTRGLINECVTDSHAVEALLTRTGPAGSTQHLQITTAPVDTQQPNLGMIVLVSDESVRIHALELADRARADAEAAATMYATLAATLQESLLPPHLPEIAGIDLAAFYHPAGDGSEIGGDFYDVFQVAGDEWFAVIGDVCGKGAHAARLTALARYTVRAAAVRWPDLERTLTDLHDALLRESESDPRPDERRFVTAAVMRLHVDDDGVTVRAGCGGHPPPLIVRQDGTVDELDCRGPLLGVLPDVSFVTDSVHLRHGDTLIVYTDGVTEARRGQEQFGLQRLRTTLQATAGRTPTEVAAAVAQVLRAFEGGHLAHDDTALLAITPTATQPTNQPGETSAPPAASSAHTTSPPSGK